MFKWLITAVIVTAGVLVCNSALDNDSWYVLTEGREIVENGLYYQDQLSMHEGLDVTVQNYGFAVIFYLLYSVLGPVGVYIGMLILNLVLCYLIYKICMLISDKKVNLSLIITILTDLLLARHFITTRAQLLSYILLMLLIYLLELYVKTGKTKSLWWIPVISLAQINLHGSMWPMLIIVTATYMIGKGYKKKPLVMALVGLVLVGFLNPYGIKMMTYIFTSFGVPEANIFITEMMPYRPLGDGYSMVLYGVIVGVLIAYILGKRKRIRARWLILMFGFLALGINNCKGLSYLVLVMLFPLAAVYKDIPIEKWGSRKIRWIVASWAGVLALVSVVTVAVIRIPNVIDGPNENMIATMNKIDEDVGDKNKDEIKIYVNYDMGGFVEYRGYKAYIDPRMEVFIKSNNHKEDIFQEYYYFTNSYRNDLSEKEFLEKYDFDYLLVAEDERLYDVETDGYTMLYEKDDENDEEGMEKGTGIRVWKKV